MESIVLEGVEVDEGEEGGGVDEVAEAALRGGPAARRGSVACCGSREKRGLYDAAAADMARDGGAKTEETGKKKMRCASSNMLPSSSSKQVGK